MNPGPKHLPKAELKSATVRFDTVALYAALRRTGTTVGALDEAMRLNGRAISVYAHLDGTRQPSGEVAALYAALLGLEPGPLYRVKLAATLVQAKRSLLKRRPRGWQKGRPRKSKPPGGPSG